MTKIAAARILRLMLGGTYVTRDAEALKMGIAALEETCSFIAHDADTGDNDE